MIHSIAGASSTTYAYLGEFFTPRHRPIVINYASLFVGISTVYVPGKYLKILQIISSTEFHIIAIAWFVMSMDWSLDVTESFTFRPWRLLTVFYFVPGLIGTIMLIKMPESPKILLSMGRKDEAYAAVEWIALKNIGKHLHDLKVEALKCDAFADRESILSVSKSP